MFARLCSSLFLLMAAAPSLAHEIVLYFEDGSTQLRPATVLPLDAVGDFAGGVDGAAVTLDTQVVVRPFQVEQGSRINFDVRFNALNSLELPFAQLVGRSFIATFTSPRVGAQVAIAFTITSADDLVTGFGTGVDALEDWPLGVFLLAGNTFITGVDVLEGSDVSPALVIEPRP